MLEGLAAWVINTYVGKYLENLNTDQLSIGLLQGEVELENLPLKKDALKCLGFPVEIRAGFVGKIKLQIPVYKLRSEPWVIFIERLFLIAGPVSSFSYDEEEENQAALQSKLAGLEAQEAQWKSVHDGSISSSHSYSYSNWMSYGTSLFASIGENVQLNIKDVHIRYEDEDSCPNAKIACGIIIHSLSAQSTDENWVPKFVSRDNNDITWKLVQLEGLSIYWDSSAIMLSHLDVQQMTEEMMKHLQMCATQDGITKPHDYVLAPVSATAHLKRNCSLCPLRSYSNPRIICDIHLEKIALSLSQTQYRQIVEWEKGFEGLCIKWKNREWRPNVSVMSNARKWWIYAISVYLEPLKQKKNIRTWSFLLQRARDITEYSKVFKEYLMKPDCLPWEVKAVKDNLENILGNDELFILREQVMNKVQKEKSALDSVEMSKGQGFLQWMFPSWVGWYSQPVFSVQTPTDEKVHNSAAEMKILEAEILDVLDSADNDTLLKRDSVSSKINFSLLQGTFTLLQCTDNQFGKSIAELEFSDVSAKFETRPRTSSFAFEIKLGGLFLHDRTFSDSYFPHIIAPQSREGSFMPTKPSTNGAHPFPTYNIERHADVETNRHLLQILYEKNPLNMPSNHKLIITTRSLDVVCNPQLIQRINNFFIIHHEMPSSEFSVNKLRFTSAARARYEVLKQQTKAELLQKWDQILDGEKKSTSQWYIELAISAPQIIIPKNIFDENSSVVVFDLGRLHFFNSSKDKAQKSSASFKGDEEDDFQTPCSTPQELAMQSESTKKLNESELYQSAADFTKESIYKSYTLEIMDIQVLVSCLKDNWKFALLRGSSAMHVLDRFSITVQMQRRTLFTEDPLWPSVTLTGTLPKLNVHISEQKVSALQSCINALQPQITNLHVDSRTVSHHSHVSEEACDLIQDDAYHNKCENKVKPDFEAHSLQSEALLFFSQFCVNQISFDVQSRGHSVAELQITGLETILFKHVHDLSVILCVRSLLVVDALQTYGPDFELLVASHRNVCMDSISGSFIDNEMNSPESPNAASSTVFSQNLKPRGATSALQSLLNLSQNSTLKESSLQQSPLGNLQSELSNDDAVITVEFKIQKTPSGKNVFKEQRIATVQFNNLDIIANQETIVELVGLVSRIAATNNHQSQRSLSNKKSSIKHDAEIEVFPKKSNSSTEITIDFHRLNVLLLRAVNRNCNTVGQKIATATLSAARIQAAVGSKTEIHGALGGFQVLDLITENTRHQKIVSVGYDPLVEQSTDILKCFQNGMCDPNASVLTGAQEAFSFVIVRSDEVENNSAFNVMTNSNQDKRRSELKITIRMASLCYTHSPRLLYELSSCATEFKDYMSALASSIKTAAVEVAKGIVTKRSDSVNASMFANSDQETLSKKIYNIGHYLDNPNLHQDNLLGEDSDLDLRIDVLLQTPIIVLPCSPSSSEVFIAHLGLITVQNKPSEYSSLHPISEGFCENLLDEIIIEVRDMNMFFMNIDNDLHGLALKKNVPAASLPCSYSECKLHHNEPAQPILHNTVIEIMVQSLQKLSTFSSILESSDSFTVGSPIDDANNLKDSWLKQIKVEGQVVTPLKVVFTKHQYHLLLKMIDNLTYDCAISPKTESDVSFPIHDTQFLSGSYDQISLSTISNETSDNLIAAEDHAQYTSALATFVLPNCTVELKGDVNEREESLVSFTFQEFVLKYKKEVMHETSWQVTLHALLMEDLRDSKDPHHCYLMTSLNQDKNGHQFGPAKSNFISSSCPDITQQLPKLNCSSSSLPDHFCTENLFRLQGVSKLNSGFKVYCNTKDSEKFAYDCPNTPPSSPTAMNNKNNSISSQNDLVQINILAVDKKSQFFIDKHAKTNLFVNVDVSCLDITFNLQTWVMVFDFFATDSAPVDVDETNIWDQPNFVNRRKNERNTNNENSNLTDEVYNSEVELTVRSLTVIFNKPEYELATANICNFYTKLSLRDHDFSIQGILGSISVSDLTPHGRLYPERFVTTGNEALHFDIFRYGNLNSSQEREYDIHVKCQMSSVLYVHTQRFISETTAFFQYFHEMQNLIGRKRFTSLGCTMEGATQQESRVLLDICANSPIIVIPQGSFSANVLIVSLSTLAVHNKFVHVCSPGTLSSSHSFSSNISKLEPVRATGANFDGISSLSSIPENETNQNFKDNQICLLDVISIDFADMDLCSAIRLNSAEESQQTKFSDYSNSCNESNLSFPSFYIRRQETLLQEKFMFKVCVERNLCSAISHSVPDMSIKGILTSVHVRLDVEQYNLLYGILGQNIGETLEECIYDPCKEIGQFVLMDTNNEVWTTMAICVDLINVTLELSTDLRIANRPGKSPLAKFDFIRSSFTYETFSDNSKDVGLVSNQIRVMDTRYNGSPANNRPSVFTYILQPTKQETSTDCILQTEIRFRMAHDYSKVTILLNNMRLMCIFDFMKCIKEFFTTPSSSNVFVDKFVPPSLLLESSCTSNINVQQETSSHLEMKINITGTELVVVEDTSRWDSNAVILKSTAVVFWKPADFEKPVSCSLQSLEMFSCLLGIEEDTALSIIDPVNVTIEVTGKQTSPIAKLHSQDISYMLEVSTMNLSIRVSYHDITMFLKMLDSIRHQTVLKSSKDHVTLSRAEKDVQCLENLGFTTADCRKALLVCKGNLNDAALWLTQNASAKVEVLLDGIDQQSSLLNDKKGSRKNTELSLNSAEIRIACCCITVIDDCQDADVPILEFNIADLNVLQKFMGSQDGRGSFVLSGDYYNCALSGWEPIVEPWRCNMKWNTQRIHSKSSRKYVVHIAADDTVNLNVTSAFLELYKTVKENWMEDFLKNQSKTRRRSQFVPFALKNETGSKLWFATQVTSSKRLDSVSMNHTGTNQKFNENALSWTEVPSNHVTQVAFENRVKIRHKDSHEMKLHQIVVRVEGWLPVTAVSVDRVGIYFRHAKADVSHAASIYSATHPARVLFSVALEGSTRKLITVQSALSVTNKLENTVEVKLEYDRMHYKENKMDLYIVPQETIPIPLSFVHAQIWVRPVDRSLAFSTNPVLWHNITKPGEVGGAICVCNAVERSRNYRFSVYVKRGNYPEDTPQGTSGCDNMTLHSSLRPISLQPGHKLIFIPCLKLINLLPYELHYSVKIIGAVGYIKPGKGHALPNIDIGKQFALRFSLENFKPSGDINISSSSQSYPSRLELYDNQDRVLLLQLKVIRIPGGAMKLLVSAPYWMINKTGLPLIFKQEGTHVKAAGQFEEHELARSMVPLLFSFSDRDASAMCNIRVGRSLHSDGVPLWCARFHMQKGVRVRRLHVARKDSRPDWVYNIGIDVCRGKGRYQNTNVVTFSPRYQLDNKTSHKLEFSQQFATKENRQYVLSALPKCSLPFHWPRIDLDNLLCVRLTDIPLCYWSGGFAIDNLQSFHIHMRDAHGKSHFLCIEIVLRGATFYIIFTNADFLPPLIRIDNLSEVAITYYQTNITEERLKTSVKAHTSVPYAWDEPTLPPYITCCAPGGSAATYNMNIFREGGQLFYENFIYIALTGTFLSKKMKKIPGSTIFLPQDFVDVTNEDLVLDVPYGTQIVLSKKETGKRSQLWRMTSTGMLQHEGSSPPYDLHKSSSSSNISQKLVLDISSLGPQPNEFIPLVLRKPDVRRHNTQTWKFTVDGRLCCGYPNMFVQPKEGFIGIKPGNVVVLGPSLPFSFMTMENGTSVEQAICRQKLRGGSGVLTVKVIPDGPTRVLQVSDLKQQFMMPHTSSDLVAVEENDLVKSPFIQEYDENIDQYELQLVLNLPGGLGFSLVNHLSEELIYMRLLDVMVEYNKAAATLLLDGSIKSIQIDNQLREAERPVLLFVTSSSKSDGQRHLPAIHFTVHRNETSLLNAETFKHLIITVKNLTVHLEERLLMKLLQFCGFNQSFTELEKIEEDNSQTQRDLSKTPIHEQRYYFSTLKLCLQQLRLTVLTTSHLPPDLQDVKMKMGLRLVRFEDAVIELDPFLRVHPFETSHFLIDSIVEHYKEELKSQAAKILGAVDFLGNPLGLMNDVSDGIAELIHDGNVGGLIKNVTHGLSDSAAKISETLSDGLGLVAMDDKHQKIRKRIRQESAVVGNDHLMAGIRGLGFGLLGGVTSLFTQTYEGAAHEGIQGFLSGLGKGLVGTVAKPAVGFLDFASGAASAVRDTSKRSSHALKTRCRPPRTCVGPGGLLPRYSVQQAVDQEFLYNLNDRNYSELLIAKEIIRSGTEDLQVLISSEQIYFLSGFSPSLNNMVLTVPLDDLFHCSYVCSDTRIIGEIRHYVQLIMKADHSTGVTISNEQLNKYSTRDTNDEQFFKKPQVRCDSREIAQKIVTQISYAKSLHEERTYMVTDCDHLHPDIE